MASPLRGLSQAQAKRTLLARLSGTQERVGVIDRAHQIAVRLGQRPNQVFLTWTRWTGAERGEGTEQVLRRLELTPTPVVSDLTSVALNPYSAGKLPVGAVRIDQISAGRYREDYLTGKVIPPELLHGQTGAPIDEARDDFFFEVVEDGRNLPQGERAQRKRFRILAGPYLSTCCTQYSVIVERMSEDMQRDGQSTYAGDDPCPGC